LKSDSKKNILVIDDDPELLRLVAKILANNDYIVSTAQSGIMGYELAKSLQPDLIILDIVMPGIDGYETCEKLQQHERTSYIPVIFLTSHRRDDDRLRAFAAGAVDYLTKPLDQPDLIEKVKHHISKKEEWVELQAPIHSYVDEIVPASYEHFKKYLLKSSKLPQEYIGILEAIPPSEIFRLPEYYDISSKEIAQEMAAFLDLEYLPGINAEIVELGRLPLPFCRENLVVPLLGEPNIDAFIVSNYFDYDLIESLKKVVPRINSLEIVITEPENIENLLKSVTASSEINSIRKSRPQNDSFQSDTLTGETYKEPPGHQVIDFSAAEPTSEKEEKTAQPDADKAYYSAMDVLENPVVAITNSVLNSAILDRASDIHIEPKKTSTVIRFRIDGDLREVYVLKNLTAMMLISRLKILANLDITEKRRPQDGSFEYETKDQNFNMRVATTATSFGESIIVRVLEPHARPRKLTELGMTVDQADELTNTLNRSHGLVLVVGPTGAGKSTTIYSLLHNIDCQAKSLITVEDPVEYHIPFANQQQVNIKAGIGFDTLLKSAVRQDPDILFLGEIRSPLSAKMAMDFAATGHMTITTLHTATSTSAFFRLERLEIDRNTIAESVICIVAQRLLKKLCSKCKKIRPISDLEWESFKPYAVEKITEVAEPAGCSDCDNTGYHEREGVFEVLVVTPEVAEILHQQESFAKLRKILFDSGSYMISHHSVQKVRDLLLSPEDVIQNTLAEENVLTISNIGQ
jgi:type II secretory ATPase GspE/PulE/Tfp pilus assembly ATPase PilB-like protein/DNA-binding NarL/FixJ family response regulator